MISSTSTRSRPTGRLRVLLVLAVLAGVLGMHALAPGGAAAVKGSPDAAPAAASRTGPHAASRTTAHAAPRTGPRAAPHGASHAVEMSRAAQGQHASGGCSPTGGGSDHADHADGTCAAAGVASPYEPPALRVLPADAPVGALCAVEAPAAARSGRAPPDLSELQLLRI